LYSFDALPGLGMNPASLFANVLQLPEGRQTICLLIAVYDVVFPHVLLNTKDRLLGRCCYAQGFVVVCVLRLLKYSNISSFVILDNFALNLSRC
jgi:hypothetical protein